MLMVSFLVSWVDNWESNQMLTFKNEFKRTLEQAAKKILCWWITTFFRRPSGWLPKEAAEHARHRLHHSSGRGCGENFYELTFIGCPVSFQFSGRTMVVATIKKQSAFQLESSADVYIHDVREVKDLWKKFSLKISDFIFTTIFFSRLLTLTMSPPMVSSPQFMLKETLSGSHITLNEEK